MTQTKALVFLLQSTVCLTPSAEFVYFFGTQKSSASPGSEIRKLMRNMLS
jgi:hypothetical protein